MILTRPYTLKLNRYDALIVCDAINQGIDGHLGAVQFKDLGMNGPERHIEIIDTDSMETLLRRLRENKGGSVLATKVEAEIQAIEPLDEFTQSYLEAALWASTDETSPEQGGEPLDANYGIGDIEAETFAEMVADCAQFQPENAELINGDNVAVESDYSCEARAGHDFWLTRTHQGCGFWDGGWTEPAATKLTKASEVFGEYNITASGDGGQVEKM